MKSNNWIFICDTVDRLGFFYKLSVDFEKNRKVFVCTRLSTYIVGKVRGINVKYIGLNDVNKTSYLKSKTIGVELESVRNCYEVKMAVLTEGEAKRVATATVNCVESSMIDGSDNFIIDWNGASASSQYLRLLRECRPRTFVVYMELANLPDSYQLDSLGTNGRALAALLPEDNIDSFLMNWKMATFARRDIRDLIEQQNRLSIPPQVKTGKSSNLWQLLDIVAPIFGLPKVVRSSLIYRITDRILREVYLFRFSMLAVAKVSAGAVFVPLQLSIDTNLVCHCDIDNMELIRRASLIATEKSKPLYVKLHPAERSGFFLRRLWKRQRIEKWNVTREPIGDILRARPAVATINSSVGWQALVADLSVSIFGRSIYRRMNKRQVLEYFELALLRLPVSEKDLADRIQWSLKLAEQFRNQA